MSMRLMSIKVFCCAVIYFLCQVALSDCKVSWVTRNVTDSFHIGQGRRLNDTNVCTTTASCQNDGSCLCNKDKPHFRNPIIIVSGSSLSVGSSYGCISSQYVMLSNTLFGEAVCNFKPFQVIPNDPKQPATTEFNYNHGDRQFTSCTFEKLEAKYPNNNTRIQIPWLNETYIQLTTSGRTLSFQWRKSVSKLQGLIIIMKLYCKSNNGHGSECLQAKVLGTWQSSGSFPATKHLQSLSTFTISPMLQCVPYSSTPLKKLGTIFSTSSITSSKTELNILKSSTTLSSKLNDQRNESNSTVIIAIFGSIVVFLVIIILLLGIYSFRLRRRFTRMQQQGHDSKEMQTRNQLDVPITISEDAPENYETLDNNRRNDEVEHTYQGLVGNLERKNNIPSNENSQVDMQYSDVKRSPISAYENPSASQDYEELDDKRRNTEEHTYQGLLKKC